MSEIDQTQVDTIINNFLGNGFVIGRTIRTKARDKYNCNIPWAIIMDPSTACNLRCTGCWAADYGNKMSMEYETLDNIIEQGKELGCYFFLFTGGEPLVRKKDIIKLCEKHNDCAFLAFTNGTLIDEEFADEIKRVKNFVPAISIEGFEEATDARRGKGTFARVVNATKSLKERHLLFGLSCCYTSQNVDVMGSEEYFDFMVDVGAKFVWFFLFMPIGVDSTPELMVSAEQRRFMFEQITKFRKTKPLFTMDFWNDGEVANGCIAGGRSYLHINANGDIEPCAFIHYSDSNIYDKSLIEAFQSPLFQQYRANQPFSDNPYRPCPLLDNKGKLAEMVEISGAKSTDVYPEDVNSLSAKTAEAADEWLPVSDKMWVERQKRRVSKSVGK